MLCYHMCQLSQRQRMGKRICHRICRHHQSPRPKRPQYYSMKHPSNGGKTADAIQRPTDHGPCVVPLYQWARLIQQVHALVNVNNLLAISI